MSMTAKLLCLMTACLPGCAVPASQRPGPRQVRAATTAERTTLIEAIKALEGDWITVDASGKEVLTSQFRLTSLGSAVREVLRPGRADEATNVYHMDGPELVVTHYAAAGNQSRLRATRGKHKGVLEFQLESVSDLQGLQEEYAGGLVLRLLDPDHVICEWTYFLGNQLASRSELDLRRRKAR